MTTTHPRGRLDELIHQPVRFSLLAGLAQADELEFRFLRDTLEVSDSVLSRQASTLEQAGYVAIRKGHVGKWPRTWLKLTPQGRTEFENHMSTLRESPGHRTNPWPTDSVCGPRDRHGRHLGVYGASERSKTVVVVRVSGG